MSAGITPMTVTARPFDLNRLADDARIAGEAPLPEAVAEHGDGVVSLRPFIVGEDAAERSARRRASERSRASTSMPTISSGAPVPVRLMR